MNQLSNSKSLAQKKTKQKKKKAGGGGKDSVKRQSTGEIVFQTVTKVTKSKDQSQPET